MSLYGAVTAFLTLDEWPFEQIPGRTAVQTGFSGDNGSFGCVAYMEEEDRHFAFMSIALEQAPADRLAAAFEFANMANLGLTVGNFEVDESEGILRFRTSIDVKDSELTETLIRNVVYNNVVAMDGYLPAWRALLEGTDPQAALEEV